MRYQTPDELNRDDADVHSGSGARITTCRNLERESGAALSTRGTDLAKTRQQARRCGPVVALDRERAKHDRRRSASGLAGATATDIPALAIH